jgi:hypothetical protein
MQRASLLPAYRRLAPRSLCSQGENMQTDPNLLRAHCVSVRLNNLELAALDNARSGRQRGAYLRDVWLDAPVAAPIPAINQRAWTELARASANLNQIAYQLHLGNVPDLHRVREQLAAFRRALIGART